MFVEFLPSPPPSSPLKLLGLVKLSPHQFYLAFSDEDSVWLCSQAEVNPLVLHTLYLYQTSK